MNAIEHKRATAGANLTAAPIEPGASGSILPEFGRVPDIERIYGLKRGLCYSLIAGGQIKSVCIRKPGAKTGVRLVQLESVRAFLNSQMEGATA